MTKQDIIEYVMNTPYNTNIAVLRTMLEEIEGSGEGSASIVKEQFEGAILEFGFIEGDSIPLSNAFNLDDVTNINIDETELTEYNLTYNNETATITVGEIEGEEQVSIPVTLHLTFTTSKGETPIKMFFNLSKGQK